MAEQSELRQVFDPRHQPVVHRVPLHDGDPIIYPLLRRGDEFQYDFRSVTSPFTYEIAGPKYHSSIYKVELLDRPVITSFRIHLEYPAYTKLPPLDLDPDIGNFSALYSTTVTVALRASKKLSEAQLRFSDGDTLTFQYQDPDWRLTFPVTATSDYSFFLLDHDSLENSDPIVYHLTMIPDQRPVLVLSQPRDGDLALRLVHFLGTGVDDYGISKWRLRYRLVPPFLREQYADFTLAAATGKELNSWKTLSLPFKTLSPGETIVDYFWNLQETDALPEDEILLFVEPLDNDRVSGPKRTRSNLIRLNVPGTQELYEEVQATEDTLSTKVQEYVRRARENAEKLNDMLTRAKTNPEAMDWEQQKQLENLIKEQEKISKASRELSQSMEQQKKLMESKKLFSPEVIKKFQELTKLLNEVMSEELREMLKNLQKQQDPPRPAELKKAMEQLQKNLDTFLEQMERFLSILKQLQLEQQLEKMARLAEELRREQEDINRNLNDSTQAEDLAHREEALSRKTNELRQEIAEAKQEFAQSPFLPEEQLNKAEDLIEDRKLAPRMEEMSQQLPQSPAAQQSPGQKLAGDLKDLEQMLQTASQQATSAAMEEINAEIDQVVHDLLIVSETLEKLKAGVTDLQEENSMLPELSFQQLSTKRALLKAAAQVQALMMKTFFISKLVPRLLWQGVEISQQALQNFEDRRLFPLPNQEDTIMGQTNQAIYLLLKNQQEMNASSSSSGFPEMLEKLAQAASQQQCLNSSCNKLLSMKPGQSSKPMSINFSQMAQEQARIRRQIESLSSQMEQMTNRGKKPLGNLGEIAGQMKEVEKQLEDRKYTERTKHLQERILTRLLDAQKSVREKERDQKRKSRSARQVAHKDPGELLLNLTPDQLRREMIQALKEGYDRSYLELLRKYYQRLLDLEQKGHTTGESGK